jgi:quercetin dioxygenase-like cupin family protein
MYKRLFVGDTFLETAAPFSEVNIMRNRRVVGTFAGLLAVATLMAIAGGRILAQRAPANPNRQVVISNINLAEIGLPDGNLSVSRFTYAPGTSMPPHTHAGRRSLTVVVQGHLTERRDGQAFVWGPGDVATIPEGASHVNENAGPEMLIYDEVTITGTKPRPAPATTACSLCLRHRVSA